MLEVLRSLFRKGQKTEVRLFDEWFGPLVISLKETIPWLTANKVTTSRLLLLVVTICLMLSESSPDLMILVANMRVIDGYTDVLDGVWGRKFSHPERFSMRWPWINRVLGTPAHFGKYFDQASDKGSNWPFLYVLMLVLRPSVVFPELSHLESRVINVLWIGFALDMVNLTRRTVSYHKPDKNGDRLSSGIGKVKTWFYSFGGVFVSASVAWQIGLVTSNVLGTIALWILAYFLIPMLRDATGKYRWYLPLWRVPALVVLGAIAATNVSLEGRVLVCELGLIILGFGVLLGSFSTLRQLVSLARQISRGVVDAGPPHPPRRH